MMISYQDMTNNLYMYDPNNGDSNYILYSDDNNIIQNNIKYNKELLEIFDDMFNLVK